MCGQTIPLVTDYDAEPPAHTHMDFDLTHKVCEWVKVPISGHMGRIVGD